MESTDDVSRTEQEADKYRRAAENTLEQLDWCVKYLYRIRKTRIAAVVDQNRTSIRRQMISRGD